MVFRFGNSLSELDFINGVTPPYVTDEDKLTRTLLKDFVSTIDANMDGLIDEEEFVPSKGIFGHHHISNNIVLSKLLHKPHGHGKSRVHVCNKQ